MYKVETKVVGEVIAVLSINKEEKTGVVHYVSTHATWEITTKFYKEEIEELSMWAIEFCRSYSGGVINLEYY